MFSFSYLKRLTRAKTIFIIAGFVFIGALGSVYFYTNPSNILSSLKASSIDPSVASSPWIDVDFLSGERSWSPITTTSPTGEYEVSAVFSPNAKLSRTPYPFNLGTNTCRDMRGSDVDFSCNYVSPGRYRVKMPVPPGAFIATLRVETNDSSLNMKYGVYDALNEGNIYENMQGIIVGFNPTTYPVQGYSLGDLATRKVTINQDFRYTYMIFENLNSKPEKIRFVSYAVGIKDKDKYNEWVKNGCSGFKGCTNSSATLTSGSSIPLDVYDASNQNNTGDNAVSQISIGSSPKILNPGAVTLPVTDVIQWKLSVEGDGYVYWRSPDGWYDNKNQLHKTSQEWQRYNAKIGIVAKQWTISLPSNIFGKGISKVELSVCKPISLSDDSNCRKANPAVDSFISSSFTIADNAVSSGTLSAQSNQPKFKVFVPGGSLLTGNKEVHCKETGNLGFYVSAENVTEPWFVQWNGNWEATNPKESGRTDVFVKHSGSTDGNIWSLSLPASAFKNANFILQACLTGSPKKCTGKVISKFNVPHPEAGEDCQIKAASVDVFF